jgi:3-deoxy-D-manno-octulosonic-acid transferase
MSVFNSVYATAGWLAAPALRRMLARRVGRGKEIAERLPERYGVTALPRPAGRLVWVHAASVGETMSVLPVIDALAAECEVLLTTGTVTSASLAAARLPPQARHQFVPLDVPSWVAAFLDHWRPDCAVFVESEIWPAVLRGLDARGIPRLLVNASMSERSARRWRYVSRLEDTLIYGFRYVHVQTTRDAARFKNLGAAGILDWGNLKYASAPLPADEGALAALRAAIQGPVWLAASTHQGEEDIVIAAHERMKVDIPGLVTIIAPRHAERGVGFSLPRRSLGQAPRAGEVYIADTMGELGLFYRLAPFAFVGGSLVDIGGHNLAEAARLGIPVITGPYTAEIAEQVATLREAQAIRVVTDAANLADAAAGWLRDEAAARAAGEAAALAFAGLEELPARLARLILETAL